jgi:hypothetical protein
VPVYVGKASIPVESFHRFGELTTGSTALAQIHAAFKKCHAAK